jgi:hypothetical protein
MQLDSHTRVYNTAAMSLCLMTIVPAEHCEPEQALLQYLTVCPGWLQINWLGLQPVPCGLTAGSNKSGLQANRTGSAEQLVGMLAKGCF